MGGLFSRIQSAVELRKTNSHQLQQPADLNPLSSLLPLYHDDETEGQVSEPEPSQHSRSETETGRHSESLVSSSQLYIDSDTGKPRALVVQSLNRLHNNQGQQNWTTVKASSNASLALRISERIVGSIKGHSNVAIKILAFIRAIIAAAVLSPFSAYLHLSGIEDPSIHRYYRLFGRMGNLSPIPSTYTEFRGESREYPKHARNTLDIAPAPSRQDHMSTESNDSERSYDREYPRLFRPRKLFVKTDGQWTIVDGDGVHVEKPYIFISYAANQFHRTEDASGRLDLTEDARKRLKERAEEVVEENNLEAYWIDFLRAPHQPEATDDVHRFCDVVRGSIKVYVLLSEDEEMNRSLAMFGKRLWCLPECLLAPGHVIYAQGGGKRETINILDLPARAWTAYVNDEGTTIQGYEKREEFRKLAEHFSGGTLTLSRLTLFSNALSAMRALEFFPFRNGDMAYALMGLLEIRPRMDPSDSEQQALARLCLSNDSDRILERMICVLPRREVKSSSWLETEDAFNAKVWDIEPLCQVAGICNDEAILIDGCHAVPIEWGSVPRIRFKTRHTERQRRILRILESTILWDLFFIVALLYAIVLEVVLAFLGTPPGPEPPAIRAMRMGVRITAWPPLILGFLTPFCLPFIFSAEIEEVQPWLIGFHGTMPIERLESMVFGNSAGRLEYTASSGLLCARDELTRTGIAPEMEINEMPLGHQIFTLVDTGGLKVTVFSASRPPTLGLLCGKEAGMLRMLLCSYNDEMSSFRKETVLRKEIRMWERGVASGRIKLEL